MIQTIKLITPQQTGEFLQQAVANLLDIRMPDDYRKQHVTDSTHISESNMAAVLDNIEFEEPIAVICYRGNSSRKFAAYLIELGYQNVASVEGGIEVWAQQLPETLANVDYKIA